MYRLEMKRLVKTRSTLFLAAAALLFSIFFALFNVFSAYDYSSIDGTAFHGLEAIERRRAAAALCEGEWTRERMDGVFAKVAEISANYEAASEADKKAAEAYIGTFFSPVAQVYGVTDLSAISPEEASQYYTQRKAYIDEAVGLRYGPAAAEAALALDADAVEPFYYEFGFGTGSDLAGSLPSCLFAVAVVCSVICAPVFASDYATGADDVQRCALKGRKPLGRARILAAVTLSALLYVLCAAVFTAIMLAVFGADSTSAQLALDALVLGDLTMNDVLLLTLGAGLLSVLAMTAFTLWLSAHMRSSVAVLAAALAVAMAPTFLIVLLRDSALGDWLRLLLPGGGLGLGTGMIVDIQVGKFLTLGRIAVWTPYAALAVPALEAPVFALLARRAYVRHECA